MGYIIVKKWAINLGGYIQMDLLYVSEPTRKKTYVTLDREPMMGYHFKDLNDPNEWVGLWRKELRSYTILAHSIALEVKKIPKETSEFAWRMHFDGG